jgi:uncharacterized protein YdhG (YjbR/CyaY superfamily)
MKPRNIDEYLAQFPSETKALLSQIRERILSLAPKAEEAISYGIPAFKLNGKYLIYMAGFAKHVSVYPAPRNVEPFKTLLADYKGGKGTVQFPLDKKLPVGLISKIVRYRIAENKKEAEAKKKKKK